MLPNRWNFEFGLRNISPVFTVIMSARSDFGGTTQAPLLQREACSSRVPRSEEGRLPSPFRDDRYDNAVRGTFYEWSREWSVGSVGLGGIGEACASEQPLDPATSHS